MTPTSIEQEILSALESDPRTPTELMGLMRAKSIPDIDVSTAILRLVNAGLLRLTDELMLQVNAKSEGVIKAAEKRGRTQLRLRLP